MSTQSADQLLHENQELRQRLEEAEDALRALRSGEADAIFVEAHREQVFTLGAAEEPYRLLVDRMPSAALTLTDEGTILSSNRLFAALLDQPTEGLRGRPLLDLVDDDDRPRLEALLRECHATEPDVGVPVALRRDDGTLVPVHLGACEVKEGPFGSCLLVTDMTEEMHYRELQATQEALREADRKKDEFLAMLAHELRNPLAPIRNVLEIFRRVAPNDPGLEQGRVVLERQVGLMARLLEDLLDVSRLSLNKLRLYKERIDLRSVLEAALETSRPVLEAGGHELTVTLPDEPIYVEADTMRLAQVFTNLLNNAAKYTEHGGRTWLSAEQQGDVVRISVRDDGIGISAEMLPRIFEVYSQAKSSLTRSQGGLGIGLSLVRGLVELHGGTVEAHSDGPGRGSEFVVRLPAAGASARRPRPAGRAEHHDGENGEASA